MEAGDVCPMDVDWNYVASLSTEAGAIYSLLEAQWWHVRAEGTDLGVFSGRKSWCGGHGLVASERSVWKPARR
ncbi:MAG: hypothetical protein ABDH29_04410 [Aquificaceae bacterium]